MIEYENDENRKTKNIREEDVIEYNSEKVDAENLEIALSIIKDLLQALYPNSDSHQVLLSHFKAVLIQNTPLAAGIAMGQKSISPTLYDGIKKNLTVLVEDGYEAEQMSIIDMLVNIIAVLLKIASGQLLDGLELKLEMQADEDLGISTIKNNNRSNKKWL
jgi:hypothetical protein